MTPVAELPQWAMWATATFVLVGAVFSLIGTFGLLRLPTFFERIHAPTIATSLGTFAVAMGSIVYFSAQQSRPVVHEILVVLFMTATTPVTFMVLARAVLHRNHHEGRGDDTVDLGTTDERATAQPSKPEIRP